MSADLAGDSGHGRITRITRRAGFALPLEKALMVSGGKNGIAPPHRPGRFETLISIERGWIEEVRTQLFSPVPS